MDQCLRELAVLLKDLHSSPATHIGQCTTTYNFQDTQDPLLAPQTTVLYVNTIIQHTCIHIIKNKNIF